LPKPASFADPWAAPIRALPLSASTLHWLESAGLFRIEELVKARATGYDKFRGLEKKQIYEIDRALSWYLARAAQLQLLSSVGPNAILEPPEPQPVPGLGSMLQSPRLEERVQMYSFTGSFLSWSDGGPMP